MEFRRLSLLMIGFALAPMPAFANEPIRVRSPDYFLKARTQKFYRLKNAKVAWVDFELMRADFPELRTLSDGRIEEWILDEFAYISELELKLRGLRVSDFEVLDHTRTFFHPPAYHRAAVAPATLDGKAIGMVDLKGDGHSVEKDVVSQLAEAVEFEKEGKLASLLTRDHSDGVASLGEAIAEVAKQRVIQAGYDLGMAKGQTLEHYFIIDSGFDIIKPNGERIPAGILGRQACVLGANFEGVEAPKLYTDDHGGFQRSITGSTRDYGGHIPHIEEVKDHFGVIPGGNPKNPQESKAWAEGHDLAVEFRRKSSANIFAARGSLYAHFEKVLGPLKDRWKRVRSMGGVSPQARVEALMNAYLDAPSLIPERAHLLRKTGLEHEPGIYDSLVKYFRDEAGVDISEKAYYVARLLNELDGPATPRLRRMFSENFFPAIRAGKMDPVFVVSEMRGITLPHDREFFLRFLKSGARLPDDYAPIFVELTIHHPYLRDPEAIAIIEEGGVHHPYVDLIEHANLDTPRLRRHFKMNHFYSSQVKRVLRRFECAGTLSPAPDP